ncbi:hypothetical protein Taro_032083 [Colocasia esculenta]|uniref:Uncharacterized protein n=1 Tax=Colocasia esculenta TaxID=4460 RepID=A0A843VRQ8_COLES|nr:hypothetical protein [Colocasia esculenta]
MFPHNVSKRYPLPCTEVIAWSCLVPVGVVGLALCGPVFLVVSARCSLSSVVPFLGANPWWHRRVWFPNLVVCLGSGVVLLVGPRPCGGLRWPCLRVPTALASEELYISH